MLTTPTCLLAIAEIIVPHVWQWVNDHKVVTLSTETHTNRWMGADLYKEMDWHCKGQDNYKFHSTCKALVPGSCS